MITQLRTSGRMAWMARVNQELEGFEKRELKLLADDRQERERMLGIRLKMNPCRFLDQGTGD